MRISLLLMFVLVTGAGLTQAQNFGARPQKGTCDFRNCGEPADCLVDGGGASITITPSVVELEDIVTITAKAKGDFQFHGINWPAVLTGPPSTGGRGGQYVRWADPTDGSYCRTPSFPRLERVGDCAGKDECRYQVTSAGSTQAIEETGRRMWAIVRLQWSTGLTGLAWGEDAFAVLTESDLRYQVIANPDTLRMGDPFDVHVIVLNEGTEPLRNIHLTEEPVPVSGDGGEVTFLSGPGDDEKLSLAPGARDTLTYKFVADSSGTVGFDIRLEAEDADENPVLGLKAKECAVPRIGKRAFIQEDCAGEEVFIIGAALLVNSIEEGSNMRTGDGYCDTGEDVEIDGEVFAECTLRAAIMELNASPKGGIIQFDIPGSDDIHRIEVGKFGLGALPAINRKVIIDGTNLSGGKVEIVGTGGAATGLVLTGDEGAIRNLAIYGFSEDAIQITGDRNVVENVLIGTDWDRSETDPEAQSRLGNGRYGILVSGNNNLIGWPGSGNVIVGSGEDGIYVSEGIENEIYANEIGSEYFPNAGLGIVVYQSGHTFVGNPSDAASNQNPGTGMGNQILFNAGGGVHIHGVVIRPRLAGNLIKSNGEYGARVETAHVFGGDVVANRFTENKGAGLLVEGDGSQVVGDDDPVLRIQGNRFDFNEDGGLIVRGARNVHVGFLTGDPGTSPGNDIRDGMLLDGTYRAVVRGNRIMNRHTAVLDGHALTVGGWEDQIGGDTDMRRNVIIGEGLSPQLETAGIRVTGTDTHIEGNYIGTDGSSARPYRFGVMDEGANTRIIENLISGNHSSGILIDGPGTARIEGNFIGIAASGGFALPNGGHGIEIRSGSARIGGEIDGRTCEAPCNVISGNGQAGIFFKAGSGSATRIEGNFVGTNSTGTLAVGNSQSGIVAQGDFIVIGGPSTGVWTTRGNLISGNGGDGIRSFVTNESLVISGRMPAKESIGTDGAEGIQVVGNRIGMTVGGTPLPNQGNGVALGGTTGGTKIGGPSLNDQNEIAYNRGAGVLMAAGFDREFGRAVYGYGNTVYRNLIYSNQSIPIDLYGSWLMPGGDGPTPNDVGDRDDGPNRLLNWPFIVDVTPTSEEWANAMVMWVGDRNAAPETYEVQFYVNPGCRGATGDARWPVYTHVQGLPSADGSPYLFETQVLRSTMGQYYSAVFTDAAGNTSEVGNCVRLGAAPKIVHIEDLSPGQTIDHEGVVMTPRFSKRADDPADLWIIRTDEKAYGEVFTGTAATAPNGNRMLPAGLAFTNWHLVSPDMEYTPTSDLCLEASALTNSQANVSLILQRNGEASGAWRPYDTRIEMLDGVRHVCAEGVSGLGQFAIGLGQATNLASPPLIAPANDSEGVDMETTFTWKAVANAATYGFQLSFVPNFASIIFDTSGFTTTELSHRLDMTEARFYWRVRGVTSGRVPGPWSETFTFVTRPRGVSTEEPETELPATLALHPNYPNPFNPSTTITFDLPEAVDVRLEVFDMLGRRVSVLADGPVAAGRHAAVFGGGDLPSGLYIYRLQAGDRVLTRRMMLVK